MDYAWLDDVTTGDWTRYHKLKDGGSLAFLFIFSSLGSRVK